MSSICKKCGEPLFADDTFCGECGAAVVVEEPIVELEPQVVAGSNVCKKCGAELCADDTFCGECGAVVESESPPPVSEVMPQRKDAPKPPKKKKRLPAIAIVGIVVGAILVVLFVILPLIGLITQYLFLTPLYFDDPYSAAEPYQIEIGGQLVRSDTDYLDLQSNYINDISSLTNLVSLYYLNLADNQIYDIAPLENLANLQELALDVNQISDITQLKNLTNLIELNLSGNPLTQSQIDELQRALPNCQISFDGYIPMINSIDKPNTITNIPSGTTLV